MNLENLLNLKSMRTASILSGNNFTFLPVTGIMVMEHSDFNSWAKSGQVILTSLYGMDDYRYIDYFNMITALKQEGCSALVFKSGRLFKEVPELLLECCKALNYPLISISKDVQYSSIMYEVFSFLEEEKSKKIDRFYEINNEFLNLGPHNMNLKSICLLLHRLLNKEIIFKRNNEIIFSTTNRSVEDEDPVYKKNLFFASKYTATYSKVSNDFSYSKFVILSSDDYTYDLCILDTSDSIPVTNQLVIESALNFLWLNLIILEDKRKLDSADINDRVNFILSPLPIEKKKEALKELNISVKEQFYLVYAHDIEKTTYIEQIIKMFKESFPRIFYFKGHNDVTFLVSTSRRNLDRKLDQMDLSFTHRPTFLIGPKSTITNLPESYSTIQKLSLIDYPIGKTYLHSEELFFISSIYDAYQRGTDLTSIVPEDLYLLSRDNPKLYETLFVYLQEDKNIKKTAEKMFFHPKTISYRLNKIRDNLDINFDDTSQSIQLLSFMNVINLFDYWNTITKI